jgi:hypothetical protein
LSASYYVEFSVRPYSGDDVSAVGCCVVEVWLGERCAFAVNYDKFELEYVCDEDLYLCLDQLLYLEFVLVDDYSFEGYCYAVCLVSG